MTNEELVVLIQAGERDRLPELWAQVERFVARQANRLLIAMGDSAAANGLEFSDLYNSGYIALVSAVDSFDPGAGCSFIGWLALALKTAFAEAGGYRSRKQARDPLHHAWSLDAPVGDDEDGAALGEFQANPAAAQAFQDVEHSLYLEQLHDALERALGTLPEQQSGTLRQRYYRGRTLDEIAASEGVYRETIRQWQEKGLQALRRSRVRRELEQFIELRTPYYMRVGVQTFQNTGESAVERIALLREQMRGERCAV